MASEGPKSAAAARQRRWRARRKCGARVVRSVEVTAETIDDWIARGLLPDSLPDDERRIREIAEAVLNKRLPGA